MLPPRSALYIFTIDISERDGWNLMCACVFGVCLAPPGRVNHNRGAAVLERLQINVPFVDGVCAA